MLTDLGGDDSLTLGELIKLLDNVLRQHFVLALDRGHAKCIFFLPLCDLLHPLGVRLLLEHRGHFADDILKVACNVVINVDVLAYLGRVYLNVDYLFAVCKCVRVAKHSV